MIIEVWADITCPWCYLGKHRLETVLREFRARVTYRAYQLDPAPAASLPVRAKALAELGDAERVDRMFARVGELARADGLAWDYERAVAVNTFDAHRLVAWAAGQDLQQLMLERLQHAHFAEGIDLSRRTELARLAGEIGLDSAAATRYLDANHGADAVAADLAEARKWEITAVPTFLVDRRFVIHGAQDTAVLRSALTEIARREAVDIAQ